MDVADIFKGRKTIVLPERVFATERYSKVSGFNFNVCMHCVANVHKENVLHT